MATVSSKFDDIDINLDPPVMTTAEVTVLLSYQGSTVTLDLTSAHEKELSDLLAPWLSVATKVEAPAARTRRPRTASAETGETTDSTTDRSPEYKRQMREWFEAQGRPLERYTRADGKPGGYRYSQATYDEYDAYLASQGDAKADDDAKAVK